MFGVRDLFSMAQQTLCNHCYASNQRLLAWCSVCEEAPSVRAALNAAIPVQLLPIKVAAEHLTSSVSLHDNHFHHQAVRQIRSACQALQMLLYYTDR